MTVDVRRRLPWVIYGLMLVLLTITLTLTVLNDSFEAFVAIAILMMLAKYAEASNVTISLDRTDGLLSFTVVDDGVGFDPDASTRGTGLQGIADRLEAIGGRLEVRSSPGHRTSLAGSIQLTQGARA